MKPKRAETTTVFYGSGLMEKNAWRAHTLVFVPTVWLVSFLQLPADRGGNRISDP